VKKCDDAAVLRGQGAAGAAGESVGSSAGEAAGKAAGEATRLPVVMAAVRPTTLPAVGVHFAIPAKLPVGLLARQQAGLLALASC
jgi:hypothetical protein